MSEVAPPTRPEAPAAAARAPAAASAGSQRIREAAIALFKQHGFHGTSMRELAVAAGMEPASLYYHYPSKQLILVDLLDRTMDDLLAGIDDAITTAGDSPADRLAAALRFHIAFHVERRDEACVSHSELRALTPENLVGIAAKRHRYEACMCRLLDAGVASGAFVIGDVKLAAKAVLMMCSGVSDWFGPGGRLGGGAIAHHYVDLVLRMVGARDSGPRA